MKKLVFWVNCQAGAIHYMLNKYYPETYDIHHFINYEYIREKRTLPDEFLDADVFIYQNYSFCDDPTYELSNILTNILNPDCVKICIPFLQCDALFCYNPLSPHNSKTISNEFPHGKFFIGVEHIERELDADAGYKSIIVNNAYRSLVHENAISPEIIKKCYDRNLEYFQNKILESDVPELYEFIVSNFHRVRLFHNRNHPTGILIHELVKGAFRELGLFYPDKDRETNIAVFNYHLNLNDWVMPILPCVQRYHGLEFDCSICSSKYDSTITDLYTFVQRYIDAFYVPPLLKQSEVFLDDEFIDNASWFYIPSNKKLIPWFSNICHYFLVIHGNYYINDFEYTDHFSEFVQDVNNNKIYIPEVLNERQGLELDRVVFIKIPFLNAGHAFGNITRAIYKIKHNPLLSDYTIVITKELVDFSPFLLSVITLFFQDVVVVYDNTTVQFKSAYIICDHSVKSEIATGYLIDRLKFIVNVTEPTNISENICLIKTPITKSGNNKRMFDAEYNDFIRTYGFMIVIPENYTIVELFRIIYGAKRVIMSWGCCSYLNSVFVNPDASVLVLGHEGYKYEYDQFPGDKIFDSEWFPVKSRMKLCALYLESDLTTNGKEILDEKIRALFI
jgi:hypothetical protein